MVTVTDALGQVANNTANVTLQINPATGPEPVINDGAGEVNVTAGGSGGVALNNSGTTCFGVCTTFWDLSCPDGRGSFANRSGDSILVTIGGNSSYDVDVAFAPAAFSCEARAWARGVALDRTGAWGSA